VPPVSILLRPTTGIRTQRALYSSWRRASLKLQPFILPPIPGSLTVTLMVEPSDAFDILENEGLPAFKCLGHDLLCCVVKCCILCRLLRPYFEAILFRILESFRLNDPTTCAAVWAIPTVSEGARRNLDSRLVETLLEPRSRLGFFKPMRCEARWLKNLCM